MTVPRIGFVTDSDGVWRRELLAARHRLRSWLGVLPPDVHALPRFLGASPVFIREGQPVDPGRFDLILAELNAGEDQLAYLDDLITRHPDVAVIPGPPEILAGRLTTVTAPLVRRILDRAPHVLAYSQEVARFCDAVCGRTRAKVIPWPFDYQATRRLASPLRPQDGLRHVVLNAPLRFTGGQQNHPFALKTALLDALAALPAPARRTFAFHTFVYSNADRAAFQASRFAEGLPVTLERRRHFRGFVRHLAASDAVVNLTSGSVLGRVTFLAAALDKPGLFSANAELNRELYPRSVVPLLDAPRLREQLTALLSDLVEGRSCDRFRPDRAAAKRIGDFAANARTFAGLVQTTCQVPALAGALA